MYRCPVSNLQMKCVPEADLGLHTAQQMKFSMNDFLTNIKN